MLTASLEVPCQDKEDGLEFRNKKTGTVVETKVELTGNWEPVKKPKKESEKKPKEQGGDEE